ncbi:MAG: hypothetical protein HGA55_04560, partial [Methanoregulaceae archaeon]|nr:hypothetical protein [Methanoregulaceae archaeon]
MIPPEYHRGIEDLSSVIINFGPDVIDDKVAVCGFCQPDKGWNHLFCRAEGTLGVMTEITVKILPTPEYIAFAQLWFATVEDAGKTAEGTLGAG